MSITVETNYEGRFKSATRSPLNQEPINVSAARFGPIDLLSAAYGSCLLLTIDNEARKKHFETTDARSEIDYELNESNDRLGKINVRLFFGKDYTDEQKEVIETAAKQQCHIGNSFDKSINKVFEFIYNGK
jgi:uncharacterized OsmC-like protein